MMEPGDQGQPQSNFGNPYAQPEQQPIYSQPGFGQPQYQPPAPQVPSHPISVFFHLAFKIGAIVSYLLLYFFVTSYVINFVVVVTFLAFDFWTTKNVTGRLLVGLRWWNEVKEDGTNEWIFESLEDKSVLNGKEVLIFWGALFASPVIWAVLAIVNVFKFSVTWLIIVIIALILCFANIYGFFKCARDSKSKLKAYAQEQATSYLVSQAVGGLWGSKQPTPAVI